ncbi:MAG: tRNA guanosine(15) transglycosylase TgtA [Candidatus Lokiarchaeota archaeon]|nr:tRNA guanosine(15) transglycosylase TgtA [Candidatus Lokiarchaeota archaeon]
MKFEILDVDALARLGQIKLNNKEMVTPNLFPVIHPSKNIISPLDLKRMGAQCLFTNAYIIYKNEKLREKVLHTGLHEYLNYDGIIATDSGAFQQYMYNDDSVDINADSIEKFQENIGSDFLVILDIPVQLEDDYEIAKNKVFTTIQRAKDNISRRTRSDCSWFGPIHGGKHLELVKESSLEMSKLDFGVYAIGGLVKAFLNYRFELTTQMLLTTKQYIIPNKPIHMFGLGLPQYFSLAVACGCDLMDSAAYVLFAKQNRYFTLSTGTKKLEELKEFPCHCPICSDFSPKEIIKFEENLRIELLAKHNLYLSFSELRTIRQAIREGNLWELVEQRVRNHPNLVKALNLIKSNKPLFEIYEKAYKSHGRLYSSKESLNRPLIYRYEQKITENYRSPKNIKYLIIIPELDVKGMTSPSVSNWLKQIDENKIIQRKDIHLAFYSIIYGIIPYELIDSFPMGQYETSATSSINNVFYQNSIVYSEKFLERFSSNYNKCALLIPDVFFNQFKELKEFPNTHPIFGLNNILNKIYGINFSEFRCISEIIHFFKEG